MHIDKKTLDNIGLHVPEILVPAPGIDRAKWSVIACDQHSAEAKYWEEVARITENTASTYNLILPEIYLGDNEDERIEDIRTAMENYLAKAYVQSLGRGWVYIRRATSAAKIRQGLLLAIDLDRYDYSADSKSLIRASEHTIVERIPSRMRIREHAVLELPHIIVLIDDAKNAIFSQLQDHKEQYTEMYNFELMLGGGNIQGYFIDSAQTINALAGSISDIKKSLHTNFLYAVGDGNHSLAAAKVLWSRCRKELEESNPALIEEHPLRFALVELINIHDAGFSLEPIHRYFYNARMQEFTAFLEKRSLRFEKLTGNYREAFKKCQNALLLHSSDASGLLYNNTRMADAAFIDNLYQDFSKTQGRARIDFVHGWENTRALVNAHEDSFACNLKAPNKNDIYRSIHEDGALAKKSFSIGESEDKRYYFEARKLF